MGFFECRRKTRRTDTSRRLAFEQSANSTKTRGTSLISSSSSQRTKARRFWAVHARALFCAVEEKEGKKEKIRHEERKLVALNETRRIRAPKARETHIKRAMTTK